MGCVQRVCQCFGVSITQWFYLDCKAYVARADSSSIRLLCIIRSISRVCVCVIARHNFNPTYSLQTTNFIETRICIYLLPCFVNSHKHFQRTERKTYSTLIIFNRIWKRNDWFKAAACMRHSKCTFCTDIRTQAQPTHFMISDRVALIARISVSYSLRNGAATHRRAHVWATGFRFMHWFRG